MTQTFRITKYQAHETSATVIRREAALLLHAQMVGELVQGLVAELDRAKP